MTGQRSPRPLRADARRNRERLLDAAEAVFAASGTGASTEEIAQRAGVGIGTVFRHFPTKEALLAAVHERLLRRLGEAAERLTAADDPGAAFREFITLVAGESPAKNAYADALAEAGVDVAGLGGEGRSLVAPHLETLLLRARGAGAVRADVGFPELRALLIGVARAVETTPPGSVARSTVITVFLDGLLPPR
ncbi:TetR/AcrR family transcriptional regulator [Streptomyces sp. NBC_01477]|uniref:TetR/AcrR family transcriptional regulator n=1 Tax=Streptomyces sp. NBC_01477 TaxID=2976015 RepID=UPI002E3482A7|nr:helix-turn-helix domain-containing protein [Streptomyces sp. NBC_01477]